VASFGIGEAVTRLEHRHGRFTRDIMPDAWCTPVTSLRVRDALGSERVA
jgi:hypothetical protein